jgi:hypothetical protein
MGFQNITFRFLPRIVQFFSLPFSSDCEAQIVSLLNTKTTMPGAPAGTNDLGAVAKLKTRVYCQEKDSHSPVATIPLEKEQKVDKRTPKQIFLKKKCKAQPPRSLGAETSQGRSSFTGANPQSKGGKYTGFQLQHQFSRMRNSSITSSISLKRNPSSFSTF